MTELTFNGVRLVNDRDQSECERWAELSPMERNHVPYSYEQAVEDCLEGAYQTAVENLHDEWWDASAPEPWDRPYKFGIWSEDENRIYIEKGGRVGYRDAELPRAA